MTRSALSGQLPLPSRTRAAPHETGKRRATSKALVYSLLLVAVGACLGFIETTRLLLLQPHKPDTIQIFTRAAATNSTDSAYHRPLVFDRLVDGEYSDYVCVGWRQTTACSPDGLRDPAQDQSCEFRVRHGASGYCEIQHRTTGVQRRVLPTHCNSLHEQAAFECNAFAELLTYGRDALRYTHDPSFSYRFNQEELVKQNALLSAARPSSSFFQRGIAMVVYDELVLSAYVSVRWLRSLGCSLPIELWYRRVETDATNPLLMLLVQDYNVFLREFDHPLATGFYTKLHAVFYSAFDSVLLLDADNFAVRDPTFLFETPEFTENGAIFWPDFWWPDHTTFNVHNTSLVWQVFDLPFTNMFEQESGQVLIDRRRHPRALNALMYYGFTLPRLHQEMRLVWGDKDLFRLAWLKTSSAFHFITRPPGSAGQLNATTNGAFCGLTMVQHDAHGEILFLHRNLEKLTQEHRPVLWTHVQQFKHAASIRDYRIGWSKLFDAFESCWGKATDWAKHFTLVPMTSLGLGHVEPTLLAYANQGVALVNHTKAII